METSELYTKLNEVRENALVIIKRVMENADITKLNLQDTWTGDYPMIGEDACLQSIEIDDNGIWFGVDSEWESETYGEENLSADELVAIAKWMEENEHEIYYLDSGCDSPLEEEEEEEEEDDDNHKEDAIYVTDGHGGCWTEEPKYF